MTEYPPLSFSTGLDINGTDMAEWLSHARFDILTASFGMRVFGWDDEAEEAERIAHDILGLLSRLKDRTEEEEE